MHKHFLKIVLLSAGAWSILQVGHELLGHGIGVLLVGGKPLSVNGMYLNHDLIGVGQLGVRWVKASGSVFNILWAFVALGLLRTKSFKSLGVNYFLWISTVINLMQAGSYIGFGRYISDGMDWAMILEGTQNRILWETLETFFGLLLLTLGIWVAVKYGKWFTKWGVLKSSRALYWIPLFTCTLLSITSSLLIPTDDRFMIVMGGIGNGFTFLFPLFVLGFLRISKTPLSTDFKDTKNLGLYFFLGLMVLFYILVMSPGFEFKRSVTMDVVSYSLLI